MKTELTQFDIVTNNDNQLVLIIKTEIDGKSKVNERIFITKADVDAIGKKTSGGMNLITPEPEVIKHFIVKQHDDWKYSIHHTIGPVDDRKEIKVRGDDLEKVQADYDKIKKKLMGQ